MFEALRKHTASGPAILFAGLGNPGEEYAHTRHNAGFDTLDVLADKLGITYWKTEHGCLVASGKVTLQTSETSGECHVILAKPQGYMNTSGGPIKHVMKAYGISLGDLVVIHDELDIEPGSIRVKHGGGLAGHNGLKSIDQKLQSKNFTRIRVGIGRPPGRMSVTDWVLSAPKKQDLEAFEAATHRAAEACHYLISHTLEQAQQEFNRS